ncbi:hypothetical protein H257_13296 [Aphanomyces astaci]|uniref:PX domain-containing protein n=1 Tax=Aphanomyces astaci TaxID=112090 RepID=W4FV74_APHAT|nr:hypothetical protein H257_13296 [Aphanomyces astaci]ETV71410.1 hypothetical protein H257_13296 [Aphanomyces astaci]|eukprot:XP_009839075.1 hypothetical protein H257_13296 [Aphanomyces astaci]
MTTTTLKRLAVARQTSFSDLSCTIQGTSIRRSRRSFVPFSSTHVVFLLKVTMPSRRSWQLQCTLRDVVQLHRHLAQSTDDAAFIASLAALQCPKRPLFRQTNALVVKSMCCELDHYLTNLLKVCQTFAVSSTVPSAMAVEATMRTFFDPSAAAKPKPAATKS